MPTVIEIENTDVAIKLEDTSAIICEKYIASKGPTKDQVTWLAKSHHSSLAHALRALPSFILNRSDVTTLMEALDKVQEISNVISGQFEFTVVPNSVPGEPAKVEELDELDDDLE